MSWLIGSILLLLLLRLILSLLSLLLLLLDRPGLLNIRRLFRSHCRSPQALCNDICSQQRQARASRRAWDRSGCGRFLFLAAAEAKLALASFGLDAPVSRHAVVIAVSPVWRDVARLGHRCRCFGGDEGEGVLERRRYRDHAHTASPTAVCCFR